MAKDQHAKHSKGMAITAGIGVTWRRIASFWRSPRAQVKARVQAVSKKLRRVDQKTLQLVDLACAHSKTPGDGWRWNNCRKVTFTLDSGAAVSAAPKSLGHDYPMQIEEPRSYMTATGEPVQEGCRILPIVTEDGLHRCMNFRVAPVHKALVSASKVCQKGYRIILDSEPGQSGMLHKHTNEWIGLREEKGVYVFDGWIFPAATTDQHVQKKGKSIPISRDEHLEESKKSMANCRQETKRLTAERRRSKVPNVMPYENEIDVRPMDFPRQENRP